GARARFSQARGGRMERPVRAGEDAARDHRAAAARDRGGRAPSRFGEAPHRSRGRAGGLDLGGARRNAAPASRAVQADHPGTGRDHRLKFMKADRTPALLTAAFFALAAPFAAAQEYPAREIRSLCNYAPGSGADLIVRLYSDRLTNPVARPVLIQKRVTRA